MDTFWHVRIYILVINISENCTVIVDITDSWNSGYIAEVTMTNTSGSRINGWDVTVNIGGNTLNNAWSAETFSQNGNIVTLSTHRRHWNSRIRNGNAMYFGFQIDHDDNFIQPSNFTLNGMACN